MQTIQYIEKLENIDNLDDLKNEMLNSLQGMRNAWSRKVEEVIKQNKYSKNRLADLCGVSRQSVIKWLKGSIPQNRDTYIRFGFAAHYNLSEMNIFLKRYGRYPELYVKNPEDCVYIYVLNSNSIEHTYENCCTIFKSLDSLFDNQIGEDNKEVRPTIEVAHSLNMVNELLGFEDFIKNNLEQFLFAYDNFYNYAISFIRKNNESDITCKDPDNRNFLADVMDWSTSMRQYIHKLYHHQIIPKRREVIALGIHLNMNLDELNQLLEYAHMEPLYVKCPTECALIYALREADLNEVIEYGYPYLYEYVMETIRQLDVIDIDLEMSEM